MELKSSFCNWQINLNYTINAAHFMEILELSIEKVTIFFSLKKGKSTN